MKSETDCYKFIIGLIYERCRVRLHDGKQALIKARLGKRMRHHGFDNLIDYCRYLENEAAEDELVHVTDALTTNFTSFLREQTHFDFLVKQALPETLAPGAKRFQIWSAACATGEEPYSIAFYCAEHFPPTHSWDWRNVMIYFDRATQEQLVRQLCQFLTPNGYLWIGHAESLHGLSTGLRCLRPSIYQKG